LIHRKKIRTDRQPNYFIYILAWEPSVAQGTRCYSRRYPHFVLNQILVIFPPNFKSQSQAEFFRFSKCSKKKFDERKCLKTRSSINLSCGPTKMLAPSVQPFRRLLDKNGQTYKQSMYRNRWRLTDL